MKNQFNINKFNSFLESAQKTISCGPDCQRQKTEEDLKNKYVNAQSNLVLAEPQYQDARRNYYNYVSGEGAYNEMIENELSTKADEIIQNFTELIDDEIEKIKSRIQTYNGLLINYRNIVDLYLKYKTENIKLYKQLKDETNDVLTNNRKTYYEDQQNDVLNSYYYNILLVIYIIIFIVFISFTILFRYTYSSSQYSGKVITVLVIFFTFLPLISTWILGTIIYIFYWLFGLLPKNVYNNI